MQPPASLACEEIEPLLAARALGADGPEERAALDAHLAVCARCRASLRAYGGVARLLPLAAPDAEPSPGLRGRVAAAVREAARRELAGEAARPAPRRPTWARRPAWLRPAPLLVGLALVAMLAWNLGLQREIAAERAARQEQAAAIAALLQAPGLEQRPLAAGDAGPESTGSILLDRAGTTAVVSLAGLPPLPPGRVYQLWLVQGEADRTSGGLFTPDERGAATVVVRAPQPLGAYRAVGVTVEPAGGSPGPTSPRVIGGPLS